MYAAYDLQIRPCFKVVLCTMTCIFLSQDLKMENYVEIGLLKASDCLIMCKYLARRANPCRDKREPDRAVSHHLIFKRNWGFAGVRVPIDQSPNSTASNL